MGDLCRAASCVPPQPACEGGRPALWCRHVTCPAKIAQPGSLRARRRGHGAAGRHAAIVAVALGLSDRTGPAACPGGVCSGARLAGGPWNQILISRALGGVRPGMRWAGAAIFCHLQVGPPEPRAGEAPLKLGPAGQILPRRGAGRDDPPYRPVAGRVLDAMAGMPPPPMAPSPGLRNAYMRPRVWAHALHIFRFAASPLCLTVAASPSPQTVDGRTSRPPQYGLYLIQCLF